MKKIIFSIILCIGAIVANAQDVDYLDENRVYNGIGQIENSNRNYFTNEGWYTTWNTLSAWYPDVLLNNQHAKNQLKRALNSRQIYQRFDDLNYKKQNKSLRFSDIDAFNKMVEDIIWREIDRMYPPVGNQQ